MFFDLLQIQIFFSFAANTEHFQISLSTRGIFFGVFRIPWSMGKRKEDEAGWWDGKFYTIWLFPSYYLYLLRPRIRKVDVNQVVSYMK